MRTWLAGDYAVGLFELTDAPVAYAVWREDDDGVYLRQFFVVREHRRAGIGRRGPRALVVGEHDERGVGDPDVEVEVSADDVAASLQARHVDG